jgi:dihydropteroate synthase
MGILNVTPDSFYDGGKHVEIESLIEHSAKMLTQGADFLDIGGASSRPGSKEISANEELTRIIPVIEGIREKHRDVIISVDTFRSKVAHEAIMAGADMINDISAGELDKNMLKTAADLKVPYVMMHMQGRPDTMQARPEYDDVLIDVTQYLSERLNAAKESGITDIIIDPGFGFGKRLHHNYRLLDRLDHLQLLGRPILIGLSRKSMIQNVLDVDAEDALNGTTALNMAALDRGANILRVHDVKEAVECVKLHCALKGLNG